MSGTLVIAFALGETLDGATREAVTAAAHLGKPVTLGIVATDPEAVARANGLEGLASVVGCAVPFESAAGGHDAQAVRTLVAEVKPEVILMPSKARAAAIAGAVAAKMSLGFATNVVKVGRSASGEIAVTRTLYRGKVHAEFEFDSGAPVLLLLLPFKWAEAAPGIAKPFRLVPAAPADPRVRHLTYQSAPASGYDLTRQEVILAVGRGVGTREGIAVFAEIAEKLGAALAASRPIVDAGWLPHDHQVGQSGVNVAPRVYLAFGISGAMQHLTGIGGARTVIAINSDGEAPIFNVADYGAVADIFEVAVEMKKLLS